MLICDVGVQGEATTTTEGARGVAAAAEAVREEGDSRMREGGEGAGAGQGRGGQGADGGAFMGGESRAQALSNATTTAAPAGLGGDSWIGEEGAGPEVWIVGCRVQSAGCRVQGGRV